MTESAVTQGGQAAYEVWRAAVPDVVCNVPGGAWEDLPATVQAGFSAIAAQQPQDARADEFARVKVRLSALVAELDENARLSGGDDCSFNAGARHVSVVTARQLRKILDDTALGVTPRPAPELATGEVVHLSPRNAAYVTPCCGQTPFHLTRTDRMTNDPSLVTCGRSEPEPAPELAAAARMAQDALHDIAARCASGDAASLREIGQRALAGLGLLAAPDGDCAECDAPRVTCPAHARSQSSPEVSRALADAVAKSDRYREALDNVFAVLDRSILTYAERISRARTLIRTAQEGK